MPNYYAHFKFGALVLDRLPRALGAELKRERPAFDLGCLGPDPLFFDRVWAMKNPARDEALRMHKEPGRVALARLSQAVEQGLPMARGYAAGFLCHYALDAACHGYVLTQAAKGAYSHRQLEAGLDRLLMDLDGYKTPRLAGFPPAARDAAVYEAGASVYERADAKALRRGYRSMSLDARLLARLCGKGSEPVSLQLKEMMEAAVDETAERVTGFLAGEGLDDWYGRDFYGNG